MPTNESRPDYICLYADYGIAHNVLTTGTARLEKGSKRFTARIIAPEGAEFEMLSVKPKLEAEIQNEDISKLGIRVTSDGTPVTTAVKMWLEGGCGSAVPAIIPLEKWERGEQGERKPAP